MVKRDLRNVPDNIIYGYIYLTPANGGIETFYFENYQTNPAEQAQLADEIANPVVVTVLSYNFLGDGLRDAADPYSKR